MFLQAYVVLCRNRWCLDIDSWCYVLNYWCSTLIDVFVRDLCWFLVFSNFCLSVLCLIVDLLLWCLSFRGFAVSGSVSVLCVIFVQFLYFVHVFWCFVVVFGYWKFYVWIVDGWNEIVDVCWGIVDVSSMNCWCFCCWSGMSLCN